MPSKDKAFQQLFQNMADAAILFNEAGSLITCNQAALNLLSYENKAELIGLSAEDISPDVQSNGEISHTKTVEVTKLAFANGSHRFEWEYLKRDRTLVSVEVVLTPITINNQQMLHAVWRDIADRKKNEAAVEKLAASDPLTGLVNRHVLAERLAHTLKAMKRNNKFGALLFIDLDHFKHINDTLGHNAGDALLKQVASRLPLCVRESDTVARFGGDEFTILIEELSVDKLISATQVESIAKKILAELNKPYLLNGREHYNTPSIGAALYSADNNPYDILQRADIAMYQAKESGRNTVRFFDPTMQKAIDARINIEKGLKEALINNEFELHYQLQIDSTMKPHGAEALLRWHQPQKGCIPPLEFITIAEKCGLTLPIGQWVLESACKQLSLWQANQSTQHLVIAVNISASQFNEDSFINDVLRAIKQHNINPHLLTLELTEGMLLENIDAIIIKMGQLKSIGVSFSLDDFGTGYSSLQYLQKLPIDQLKIDQSFIKNIQTNKHDRTIVQMIIAMAKSLQIEVIAEGVETDAQQKILIGYGCKNFQGYLFARPLPINEFKALLT